MVSERPDTRRDGGNHGTRDAARTTAPNGEGAADAPRVERRRNPRLRELIDEMLASVRAATRRELWTDEERRRYESELAEVMRQVRFEAVWKGPPPAQPGGAKEAAGDAGRAAGDAAGGTA